MQVLELQDILDNPKLQQFEIGGNIYQVGNLDAEQRAICRDLALRLAKQELKANEFVLANATIIWALISELNPDVTKEDIIPHITIGHIKQAGAEVARQLLLAHLISEAKQRH